MQKDDATWLKLSYLVCALISSFVMWKFFQTLGIQFSWLDKYSWFQSVAIVASLAIGFLFVFWLKAIKNAMSTFFKVSPN